MERFLTSFLGRFCSKSHILRERSGMELVQVAILVAIAVAAGIIFKSSVVDFVNRIFRNLNAANF